MIWNNSKLFTSHLSRAIAILVDDCCQFGPSWMFGLKWSLWPVPAWLEVQWRKSVFFLTSYVSINYMKHLQTVYIKPQPCHSHFVVDCCQFGPSWMFGLKMELMVCAGLVGGTTEQSCLFSDHKWYYQWYETLPKLSLLHNSRATAIFVFGCCQFGPS